MELLKSERDAANHQRDKTDRQLKDCQAQVISLNDRLLKLDIDNKKLLKRLTESDVEMKQLEKLLSGWD